MTLIYSDVEITEVVGAYVSPIYFDGVEKGVSKVYATDKAIIEAYKEAGVEVISPKATRTK